MTDSSSEESENGGDFLDLDQVASTRAARQAKNSLVVDAGTIGRVSHCSSESSTHGQPHVPDNSSPADASNRHHQRRNRDKSRTDRGSNHNQKGWPKGSHSSRSKQPEGLPTINDFSSDSYSSTTNKRQSNFSSNSIIMAKLEELSRLLAARPTAARDGSSLSYTNSRADTYTTHTGVKSKVPENDRKTGSGPVGRGGECVVAYADVPSRPIERMRGDRFSGDSRRGMPGGFCLDDPVRLYQQAMRLEAKQRLPTSSSSQNSSPAPQDSPTPPHSSPQNTTPSPQSFKKRVIDPLPKDLKDSELRDLLKGLKDSTIQGLESVKKAQDSSPKISTNVKSSKLLDLESHTPLQLTSSPNFTKRAKTMDCAHVSAKSSSARVPSLCALCRFYWRITQKYFNAYASRMD